MAKTSRRVIHSGVAAAVLASLFGFVYARHVDWPTQADEVPLNLAHVFGTDASSVRAFYIYDLGGFIDHEWLWRIECEADTVALIITRFRLHATNTIPQQFWEMPPHYWPRSMPSGAEAFQSSSFYADSRGPDGPHYFLLHDKTHGRAFVWFKSNF